MSKNITTYDGFIQPKYAIKHINTGKYIFDDSIYAALQGREDFGSTFLSETPDMVFKNKDEAEFHWGNIVKGYQMMNLNIISFETGEEIPIEEFKIVKL